MKWKHNLLCWCNDDYDIEIKIEIKLNRADIVRIRPISNEGTIAFVVENAKDIYRTRKQKPRRIIRVYFKTHMQATAFFNLFKTTGAQGRGPMA